MTGIPLFYVIGFGMYLIFGLLGMFMGSIEFSTDNFIFRWGARIFLLSPIWPVAMVYWLWQKADFKNTKEVWY